MATRVPGLGELLCVNELERKLTNLSEQVELKKEEVRSNFQQLHDQLFTRETFLLKEMDDIVTLARQEVAEKKTNLQQLYTAKEGLERDLYQNRFKNVLEKNLRELENEIGEVARDVNVGWMELEWKRKDLEHSMFELCKVVSLKERPATRVDYPTKLCPLWSHDGTISHPISYPHQIAIDGTTQYIYVADWYTNRIQVFNGEGNHFYEISTPPSPIGIALTDEHIFVSTDKKLVLKIRKSNNKSTKSAKTENLIWGIETDTNSGILLCEVSTQSIVVIDRNLKFLKRIRLESTQVHSDTRTYSIRLYEDNMYVMFGGYSPPPFHLQIFTLEGELVRCLIKQSEIRCSYFFSIDQLGNIIVADCDGNQIKIFSKEGEVLYTITSDMLLGDQKFIEPTGIAIDKQHRIIVAHRSKKCNLLAF